MSKPLITESKRIGNLVITSGITAPPGDVATQARSIFEKIKKILEKQGTSMKHVLKANVYLADIGDREPKFNGIWREYFPDNPPARTTVQVGLGPGTLVEVEVVAEIPEK
jgi:2-iminobutanoate/2-iminopropanoate deaminase